MKQVHVDMKGIDKKKVYKKKKIIRNFNTFNKH